MKASGRHRTSSWSITRHRVLAATRTGTGCQLRYCTDTRFFTAFCRLRAHSSVIGSMGHSTSRSADPMRLHRLRAASSPDDTGNACDTERPRASRSSRVMMSMGEYDERFRSLTSSLHQIFAATGTQPGTTMGSTPLGCCGLGRNGRATDPSLENGHLLGLLILQPFQPRRPRGLSAPETAGLRPRGQ